MTAAAPCPLLAPVTPWPLLPAVASGAPTVDVVHHCDALTLLKALPDGSVDMVFIDPPYGNENGVDDLAAARARDCVKGGRTRGAIMPIANDRRADWLTLMPQVFREVNRVLKNEASCCCCCGGGGPSPVFANVTLWLDQYLDFFQAIVWDKSARGNGLGWRYRRNYEFVMVASKKGGKLAWNEARPAMPNVIRDHPTDNQNHPTEKPLSLVKKFIENHTLPGALIVDCFAGGGGTLLAARDLGRHFIGGDIEPVHVATTRRRLAEPFTPSLFAAPTPARADAPTAGGAR